MQRSTRYVGPLALALLLLGSLLAINPGASLAQQGSKGQEQTAPPQTKDRQSSANPSAAVVITGNPINITVNDNTSVDLKYNTSSQYFGGNAEGAYLWYTNTAGVVVYGPGTVPAGNTVSDWVPISNNVSGSGTAASPFRATTVVQAGGGEVQMTQVITYINGQNFANFTFQVTAPTTATWNLFHAADLYTQGNDTGYAYLALNGSSVDVGGRSGNPGSSFYQFFRALTPASHYMEASYRTIWDAIGSFSGPGPGFNDTTLSQTIDPVDNGAGLQWDRTGSATISDLVAFNAPSACAISFTDVLADNPFYSDILFLACATPPIVNGFPNGDGNFRFEPASQTSRGQFAKIAVLAFGVPAYSPPAPSFNDVATSNTFYAYIEAAVHASVISGFAQVSQCAGTTAPCYRPRDSIRRGEVAKIIVRSKNYTLANPSTPSFADVSSGSTFYSYIETLKLYNVVSGSTCAGGSGTCYRPSDPVSRGELSKITRRAREISAPPAPTPTP